MNTAAKGGRNERRSRAMLEAAGYHVTRAAASHGAWDLVAIGPADLLLVQVKSRDWPGFAEMARLQAFPAPPGVRKVVHRWRDRASVPDVREVV